MTSSFTDKQGNLQSRFKPTFSDGSIVTDPRSQAFYLVTEYGIANLAGRSSWERTETVSYTHLDVYKRQEKGRIVL